MKGFAKIFSVIFTFLFLWAAYLQYNDPDPLLWYAIYGLAALASVLFLLNRLPLVVVVGLAFGYLMGSYVFWPEKYEGFAIGGGDIDNIEWARESVGLLINAMIMLFYAWQIRFRRKVSM